jgi:hypothetical protein
MKIRATEYRTGRTLELENRSTIENVHGQDNFTVRQVLSTPEWSYSK